MIKEYPSSQSIKKFQIDVLAKLLTKASHDRYKRENAIELKKLAEESISIPSQSFALQTYPAVNQIELFDSPSKVLAYAGLNPVVRQSGKWRAGSTRMSKRGDPLLLYTLI